MPRVSEVLPPEPREIKPHPYGVELGMLVGMLKETKAPTVSQFLTHSFSRVSPAVARRICAAAKVSTRASTRKCGRHEADQLYQAIQQTKISAPATDCISPIGEELILRGLHQVVPGEFYAAATRPPAVYRGNPFAIEVGLAYGGASTAQKVSQEALHELLAVERRADAAAVSFHHLRRRRGRRRPTRSSRRPACARRVSPGKLKTAEIAKLHEAMRNVNLHDGQSMTPPALCQPRAALQFQAGACAITQTVMATNWRSYGLSQSRGAMPSGPVTLMVHMASVWVPFTSESKEAVAGYPEIQKELRLARRG